MQFFIELSQAWFSLRAYLIPILAKEYMFNINKLWNIFKVNT